MKPEEIKIWQQRISRAEELQNDRREERKQILKLYLGEFFAKPTDNSGEITEVNFVYEYTKVLVGAVYAKDPHIFVRARSGKRHAFAETMEQVINYYWVELQLKKKIKQSIMDAVLSPPGFIELGYFFLKEKKNPEIMAELEAEFPELKEPKLPLELSGIFDETVKEDDVFANYVSSWDVLWPDGYHDIRECPYLFIRRKMTLLDVKANESFKPVRNNITGFETSKTSNSKPRKFSLKDPAPVINMTADEADDENVDVTLYYAFDRRGQKRFVLAKNFEEDTLFEKPWKYLPEGHPIFPLIFNEIPKTDEKANSYPLSDVIPMLPQLKELSKISSAMMRHRKRSGTVIVARKGEIQSQEITNLQNANDLDIVEIENYSKDNMNVFTPPALPADFYRLREVILDDLMRISGFHQLLSSGASSVETATESENIRAGAMLRQSEKIDIIEDFSVDVARFLAGLIWQFIQDKQRIAEIIGEDEVSEDMWPSLPTNEDGSVNEAEARRIIQKEIFFEIEAGSTRPPKDENVERKLWMDLVSTIKANFPGRLNDSVILPQLLKKFDFKDIDQAVISFDDEEAQAAQQENALLLQGIPVPVSPNQNHKIHLQVHAMATNQGMISPALDEHLLKHAEFEQRMSPTASPQKGDGRIAPQTTTPEIKRRGVPENVDLVGASNTPQRGINRGR